VNKKPVAPEHAPILDQYELWLRSWSDSERTVEARMVMARARLHEWGLDGLTGANVIAFLARPGLSRWTRSTYHAHLTCFLGWMTASGFIEANPMDSARSPKRPKSIPRPLSEPEVERVLSVVQGRVRDWIMLALLQGLRASEIAKIRGEDVTGGDLYVDGKGGKQVVLPAHPDIQFMATRMPAYGPWFPGPDDGHVRSQQVSLIVGRLFHSLGITGSIHRCRHVYGTRLQRSGMNIRTVQKLMRHENLDTTAAYSAVDEDELRAGILMLPSLMEPTSPDAA